MTVGRVMCTRLVTVRADDTVLEAINLMVEEQVVRARLRRPEARRDLHRARCSATRLAAAALEELRVGDVMTVQPVTIDPFVAIIDAAQLMGERGGDISRSSKASSCTVSSGSATCCGRSSSVRTASTTRMRARRPRSC